MAEVAEGCSEVWGVAIANREVVVLAELSEVGETVMSGEVLEEILKETGAIVRAFLNEFVIESTVSRIVRPFDEFILSELHMAGFGWFGVAV